MWIKCLLLIFRLDLASCLTVLLHVIPAEMVTKICTESGRWFLHPESNRTWSNYTTCNEHTNESRVVGGGGWWCWRLRLCV